MKRTTAKEITLSAALTALALVLSLLENALPPLLPLPGMKLGLANIVSVYALYAVNARTAVLVLFLRIVLGSMFAGQASAFLYSLFGGAFSMLVMLGVKKTRCSLYGVSVSGSAAHACGQVLAAALLVSGPAPVGYLAPMLFVSVFTGAFSAFTVSLLLASRLNVLY